ncbi:helix-turn-helix domain-containing protein [Saccharopolyspora sp. MS10]|uniref:helix-turn-helix domain-containing protein n=1 Tax=Saccharopolyspora sp. MS10 TaxID=3385973 RepID=UPI0039A0C0E3
MNSGSDSGGRRARPQVASGRSRLGRELRRLRRNNGLSGPRLAELLGWSQSKVSRLENGERSAAVADVAAWSEVAGADERTRARLMELAASLLSEVTGLRALHRGALERRQSELQGMDAQAKLVRQYQPLVVPGVFHTEPYARGCIAAANLTAEKDVDAAVAKRLERGRRVIASGGQRYHTIVCESAFRWRPVGVPSEVLPQLLRHLAWAVDQRGITMQIVPDGAPTAALPQCGFTIWEWEDADEPDLVLVETPPAEVTFTGKDDVGMFELVWQGMVESALSPSDSRELIRQLAEA